MEAFFNKIRNKKLIALFVLSLVSTKVHSSDYPELNDPSVCENDSTTNNCTLKTCPNDSIGIFPNCKCTVTNFDYSVSLNTCFRVCPINSTGYWPNCECFNGFFDKAGFKCIECPPDTVSGIYPNCVCADENARFNAHLNYCEFCPPDSSGIIPNCICNDSAG